MGYVIRLNDPEQPRIDGRYLHHSPGESGATWTARLEEARVFPTREAADRGRCPENETVVSLAGILIAH